MLEATKETEPIYCRTPGCQARLGTRTVKIVLIRGVRSKQAVNARCKDCGKWHDYAPIGVGGEPQDAV